MRNNNKGFTLMEILAVIVILGVIMLIAIPNISKNISDSRKAAFVTSIQKYIESARQEVQTYSIKANNENATYYIPTNCLGTENGDTSPYGDMMESYVVVNFSTGGHYEYYYAGRDDTNHGMQLTKSDEVNEANLRDDVFDIDVTQTVGGRDLAIVYSSSCDGTTQRYGSETSIVCGKTAGDSTGWTYADRTVTVECVGNCKETMVSKTFNTTTERGTITITDRDNHTKECPVNVYVDKSAPGVDFSTQAYGSGQTFKLTKTGANPPSGFKLMYCVDNTDTCTPNIEVKSGVKVEDTKAYIGKYYVRYAIYTGAGYSKIFSNAVSLEPHLEAEPNNDDKKVILKALTAQGTYASGTTIYYCKASTIGGCNPTSTVSNGGSVSGNKGQCVTYYMKKDNYETLKNGYCFW